jgi:histidine triad (HIT) family protein
MAMAMAMAIVAYDRTVPYGCDSEDAQRGGGVRTKASKATLRPKVASALSPHRGHGSRDDGAVNIKEGCDFCQIVAEEEPARMVMRADQVVAFFPLQPATVGHTLVVPTSHIPDIWALDDDTAATLAHATMRVARAAGEALSPDGLNIIQSNGSAATQTVQHLHVHVVPRWVGDAMGPIWPLASTPAGRGDKEILSESQALQAIRDAMKSYL